MNLEHAFSLIRDVEAQVFTSNPTWSSINFWPLMRQCLWSELISTTDSDRKTHSLNRAATIHQRTFNRIITVAKAFRNRPPNIGSETTAFISRPVYLQELPNSDLFDRIVDPLIFCLPGDTTYAKYYVAPWPEGAKLKYHAAMLRPFRLFSPEIPEVHRALLVLVANETGITPKNLILRYSKGFKAFNSWHQMARRFFDSRRNLKTVYLTSWYFPDMMALIAAARERGIKTIDVQHGKQGKLQAMYCGWRIPDEGYEIMPDIFWNWGKPSAEHILCSSPDRKIHRPIVGGFPWLNYYCQHVSSKFIPDREAISRRVLITIQSPQGENTQPIADFLLDFLHENPREVFFIFRCHPNDQKGPAYCRHRLSGLPRELYTINDGRSNLYDSLLSATHHITAYSSCCYEASVFGIPTLLFGEDARTIYNDEIENGLFSWTPGIARDLTLWLDKTNSDNCLSDDGYINSSLEHVLSVLRRAEYGEFDYYATKDLDNA